MDDLWDEDRGDNSEAKTELSREWETRREKLFNVGYREGLEEGKQVLLQQGFDQGFKDGMAAGLEWGALRGAVLTLQALAKQHPDKWGEDKQQQIGTLASDTDIPPQRALSMHCAHVWDTTTTHYCDQQLVELNATPQPHALKQLEEPASLHAAEGQVSRLEGNTFEAGPEGTHLPEGKSTDGTAQSRETSRCHTCDCGRAATEGTVDADLGSGGPGQSEVETGPDGEAGRGATHPSTSGPAPLKARQQGPTHDTEKTQDTKGLVDPKEDVRGGSAAREGANTAGTGAVQQDDVGDELGGCSTTGGAGCCKKGCQKAAAGDVETALSALSLSTKQAGLGVSQTGGSGAPVPRPQLPLVKQSQAALKELGVTLT